MRDRLIELLAQKSCVFNEVCDRECSGCGNLELYSSDIESIADHLLANGVILVNTIVISSVNRPLITHFAKYSIDEILSVMRAKEEGRAFISPCKVGDTVYYIQLGKVYTGKCHAISLKPSLQIHLYDCDGDNARIAVKNVFLKREEAEQALKGGAE